MLIHCLRRWPSIEPTVGQYIVVAGLNEPSTPVCFTHEGGEHPTSLKLQNQLCKAQNLDVWHLAGRGKILFPPPRLINRRIISQIARQLTL